MNITFKRSQAVSVQTYTINATGHEPQKLSAEMGLAFAIKQTGRQLFVCVSIGGDIVISDDESMIDAYRDLVTDLGDPQSFIVRDVECNDKTVILAVPAAHGRASRETTEKVYSFFRI